MMLLIHWSTAGRRPVTKRSQEVRDTASTILTKWRAYVDIFAVNLLPPCSSWRGGGTRTLMLMNEVGIHTYQTEADAASKSQILSIVTNLGIGEEESHGDASANDHGSPSTPEPAALTHISGKDGARNRTEICDSVVAPISGLGRHSKFGAACGEIRRQEHIIQRISKTNQQPGEPDQGSG